MFITILFLIHGCIFQLVTSNPLHGFPSYPIIQYQESYKNEPPIIVHASDLNTYPQLSLIQNQVTPYQNIPISYNDLVQEIFLRNILQNQINPDINANCCQVRQYVNPTDILIPNHVNNYILKTYENNLRNKTKYYFNRESEHPTRVSEKSNIRNDNDDQKKKRKCRKRKNTSSKTNEKNHDNKEKCPRRKQSNRSDDNELNNQFTNDNDDGHENKEKYPRRQKNSRTEEDNQVNKQSNNQDIKLCRKNKCRNKPQSSDTLKEKEILVDSENFIRDANTNLKSGNNQNNNKKNLNKVEKTLKFISSEDNITETNKRDNNNKNKSNNCRKAIKNDDSYGLGQILELDDYFDINADCAELDHRCTRNYKEDNIKKYHQRQHIPRDFTNNIAAYNMFNPQLFDTNGYLDYLYNMQEFLNGNLNPPQKKPHNNQRTGRKEKKKKGNKNNCHQNKQDSKKSSGCEQIEELSPTVADVAIDSKPTSSITGKPDETQIEKYYQDIPDTLNKEEIDVNLGIHDNSKVISPNNCYNWNHENPSSSYDDYYPVFHSDVYISKEEFDWNNFNERHYYSSEMSDLGRKKGKYDSADDVLITQQDNIFRPNNPKLSIYNEMDKQNEEKVPFGMHTNEEKDNPKLKTPNEEIQFITPPVLDFPDFKTEMINKEKHIPRIDISYQPNNKEISKLTNNKMSSNSYLEKAESNEDGNKIVKQNYVETDCGHSKVVKYGAQPNEGVKGSENIINDSDNTGEENKSPYYSDGKTTIVIAKSLPYPI